MQSRVAQPDDRKIYTEKQDVSVEDPTGWRIMLMQTRGI
jgi:hypothetical protein